MIRIRFSNITQQLQEHRFLGMPNQKELKCSTMCSREKMYKKATILRSHYTSPNNRTCSNNNKEK